MLILENCKLGDKVKDKYTGEIYTLGYPPGYPDTNENLVVQIHADGHGRLVSSAWVREDYEHVYEAKPPEVANFKVGDKVRQINKDYRITKIGDEGTVMGIYGRDIRVNFHKHNDNFHISINDAELISNKKYITLEQVHNLYRSIAKYAGYY